VLAVLKNTKFTGPDKFGFYRVAFPDGSDVDFSAEGLQGLGDFSDCAIHIHGLSSHITSFIFEIARAGDMVILPAMDDFVPILLSPEQKKELPAELAENDPKPVLCGSSGELEALLSDGHTGWLKYRDQVLHEKR